VADMKSSTPECEENPEISTSGFVSSMSKKGGRRAKACCAASASPEERFFTIEQVAENLNVCDRTVRRWINRKKLIAYDFEGIIRISGGDLRDFIGRGRRS
jgi:excisionase family DNA binding protein